MSEPVRDVLVIGPNPAMDIVLETPGFRVGESQRARRSLHLAGGKPLNVARTLRRLGVPVRLVAPLGGRLGPREIILQAAADLGIDLTAVGIQGETRTCVIVADTATGQSSVVNELGPTLSDGEAAALRDAALGSIRPGDLVLLSGSLPPGVPVDLYAEMVIRGRSLGARAIVDTSGEPLRLALEADPWALKVNEEEIQAIAHGPFSEALAQVATGDRHVVITRGREGSFYVGPEGTYAVPSLPLAAANPTGAGDAFLAGIAAGLVGGSSWPHALRLATAAAGLACSGLGPDIGPSPAIDETMRRVDVRPGAAMDQSFGRGVE